MFSVRIPVFTATLLMCVQITVNAAPVTDDDTAAIRRPLPNITVPTAVDEQPAATFSNDIPPPPPLELEPTSVKPTKEHAP